MIFDIKLWENPESESMFTISYKFSKKLMFAVPYAYSNWKHNTVKPRNSELPNSGKPRINGHFSNDQVFTY